MSRQFGSQRDSHSQQPRRSQLLVSPSASNGSLSGAMNNPNGAHSGPSSNGRAIGSGIGPPSTHSKNFLFRKCHGPDKKYTNKTICKSLVKKYRVEIKEQIFTSSF